MDNLLYQILSSYILGWSIYYILSDQALKAIIITGFASQWDIFASKVIGKKEAW